MHCVAYSMIHFTFKDWVSAQYIILHIWQNNIILKGIYIINIATHQNTQQTSL